MERFRLPGLVVPLLLLGGCLGEVGEGDGSGATTAPVEQHTAALTAGDWQVGIDIIVHPAVYSALSSELSTLVQDMNAEGWSASAFPFTGSTAADLKGVLQRNFSGSRGHMAGALFIGDLPTVKCLDSWTTDPGVCDYYFMDLDGDWRDTDGDGNFDYQAGGRAPEIFVGRLNASSVSASTYGKSEVELLRDYLKRDHRFRKGLQPTAHKSELIFLEGLDGNASFTTLMNSQAALYPETLALAYQQENGYPVIGGYGVRWSLANPAVRTTGLSRSMVLEDFARGTDYVHIDSHGMPTGLAGLLLLNSDVAQMGRAARLPAFVVTHACDTAKLSETDNLGAVATMGGVLGYLGSASQTYGTDEWDTAFVNSFAQANKAIGEANKALFQAALAGRTDTSLQWTPVINIFLGDPTLRRAYTESTSDPDFVNSKGLEVYLADGGSDANSTAIKLYVKNTGSSPLALAGMKMRYELSAAERAGIAPVLDDYYSPATTPRLVAAPSTADADRWYIEFEFGSVTLNPGQVSSNGQSGGGEQVRVHFADWQGPWADYNDYSGAFRTAGWSVSKRVSVYQNGALIYGFRR